MAGMEMPSRRPWGHGQAGLWTPRCGSKNFFFFKVVGSTTIISDEGLIFCTSGSLLRLSKRHGPSPVWGICLVWAGPGP